MKITLIITSSLVLATITTASVKSSEYCKKPDYDPVICNDIKHEESEKELERVFTQYLKKSLENLEADATGSKKSHEASRQAEFEAWKAWRNTACRIDQTDAGVGSAWVEIFTACKTKHNLEKIKKYGSGRI